MAWFHRVRKEDIGVTDGDTIWHMSKERKYRLVGYDTPERAGRAKSEQEWQWAEDAANYLKETIRNAQSVRIVPKMFGKRYTRHNDRLARLYVDGRDIKDIMIDAEMAVDWSGGKRPPWKTMERSR